MGPIVVRFFTMCFWEEVASVTVDFFTDLYPYTLHFFWLYEDQMGFPSPTKNRIKMGQTSLHPVALLKTTGRRCVCFSSGEPSRRDVVNEKEQKKTGA